MDSQAHVNSRMPQLTQQAPDLWVTNGGLHYALDRENSTARHAGRRAWERGLRAFLSVMRLRLEEAPRAVLALIGTTRGVYPSTWKPTVATNEIASSLVAKLSATVGERASYIDLPGLVRADDCGMPHNFPFRCMEPANGTDGCGNRVVPKDIHFTGAAYLHLAEILLHLLWRRRPMCPPDKVLVGPREHASGGGVSTPPREPAPLGREGGGLPPPPPEATSTRTNGLWWLHTLVGGG